MYLGTRARGLGEGWLARRGWMIGGGGMGMEGKDESGKGRLAD